MDLFCRAFLAVCFLCCGIKGQSTQDCASCDGKPKVICYFTSWAWYRGTIAKYFPEDVPTMCTHVVYAFASLSETTLTIVPGDPWADINNNFYRRITSLKKKNILPIISLGGWADSIGNKYSQLINNATARKNFIQKVTPFLEQYGFVGLDIDWEYPKCWQGNCAAGPNSDKINFGMFMSELRAAFKPKGFTLSVAVPGTKYITDLGYDVQTLGCALDWINVMTYEYHPSTGNVTGANAPFFGSKDFGTVQSLQYWASKGAPKCKLMVGVPFYAHSHTLKDVNQHDLGSPAVGYGVAGKYTQDAGSLSYYEVCLNIKNDSWHSVSTWTDSTYAYKDNQWASYCDVGDVEDRMWLVKKEGYGGAFIWALEYDDVKNLCGCGTYPLLTTMARELLRLDVQRVQCY